jgi:hypothetical protein
MVALEARVEMDCGRYPGADVGVLDLALVSVTLERPLS